MTGYINKNGEVVIPFKYVVARNFSENIAIVSTDYRNYEFINTNGETIGQIIFRGPVNLSDFHEGLMVNQNAYYNVNGECVIHENVSIDFVQFFFRQRSMKVLQFILK